MLVTTVEEAIRARRSVRDIVGPPLDADEVDALVALALTAPAPHHTRPWRFVDILPARRSALATAMADAWRADMEADGVPPRDQQRALDRSRRQVESAPTLLLGCAVSEGLREYRDTRRQAAEWTLATHSFGAAMQNILLAASVRGLGAYWISAPLYAADAVRSALDIDARWEPQALIAIGHPGTHAVLDRPSIDLTQYLIRR